ncbi:hypothetical protein NMG60_11018618 [Bertholletia excelsa]
MPPEPLPWDRKELFKERKQERSSESVSRWREAPHHGSSLSRDAARWGSAEFRCRPLGHAKQGGWNFYSEGSGHGLMPVRSNDKFVDDESCRQSGSRADGKFSRSSSRENRGSSFGQKDWKGQSWENGASPNGSGRPPMSDKRSVDDMVTHNFHPHSDFVNSWDQVPLKDQHDKTGGVNTLGTSHKIERETLGSIDWKPLKWNRSGSLSSRNSGFTHSSSSKSMGTDSSEAKAEQLGKVSPIQSPSGDAVACATSVAPSEETSSRKKPRLKWGEGLAKYEKKKVEGPEDGAAKLGVVCGTTVEPLDSQVSILADKSPKVAGFSDCASPATPSSVACSSSPGVEDKSSLRAVNVDTATSNLSGSPAQFSQHHLEGRAFNLENLELASIANLSYALGELLQSDDPGSVDSIYVRSTAMNKLLLWKTDILKALEMTETEIDSLENELKSLKLASGNNCSCPATSSPSQGESQAKPCEGLNVASIVPRPAPLALVSSGDRTGEKAVGGLKEECDQVVDEDIDSPGTATSKFVEQVSSAKGVALSDMVKDNDSSGDLCKQKSGNLELNFAVNVSVPNGEEKEGLSAYEVGDRMMGSKACSTTFGATLLSEREDILYEFILASNRDSANRASEVFNKLLPSDQSYTNISGASCSLSCVNQPSMKDKFAMRNRFLRFKERVITLKFRALHHLWKEDLRLLSIKKNRVKSQKRMELSSRALHGSYQKHRSSARSRLSLPDTHKTLRKYFMCMLLQLGLHLTLDLDPGRPLHLELTIMTKRCLVMHDVQVGVWEFKRNPYNRDCYITGKLLSDTKIKPCRTLLKMPAMILDKKEKIISRFVSSNGLVEDPYGVEKERAMINPWTTEEREIFMAKFAIFGKDFQKIASFLNHKTIADCIEFYYKNHKSDGFAKGKKNSVSAKQGKFCFTNNYLLTSGKRWSRETNAASLDILGAASAIAANNNDFWESQQKCKARFLYRTSQCHDGAGDRSGNLDIFDSERESMAADVLAGICGSVSSEAMSSCITSSFEPGESCQERKRQKVGFSMRRPLTPEVTQNIAEETCSDESCEEMDPTDWTDEEKSIFMQAVASYGKDFTKISRCVRTRSMNQCKVFFSKARKCLGLDTIYPRTGDGGQVNENANGGGTDNEDACVVENGSATCSDKLGSKRDEDVGLSDLKPNLCESDPAEVKNLQTDLNRSEENKETRKIHLTCMKHLVTDDLQAKGKREVDSVDGKVENSTHGPNIAMHQDHESAVLPSNTVVGVVTTGETAAIGDLESAKEAKYQTENNLNSKKDENKDTNDSGLGDLKCSDCSDRSASDFAAGMHVPVKFDISPKQEQTATQEVNQNSLSKDPDVHRCERRPNLEAPLALDLEETSEKQNHDATRIERGSNLDSSLALELEKLSERLLKVSASANDYNQHHSSLSVLGNAETSRNLTGYPLPVATKKLMNGDINSKKLDPFENLKKMGNNSPSDTYLAVDSFLKKCSNSKAESSVSELSFLSQEQKGHHSRPHSWSLSEIEKPSRNGDVKLFGQILTHPLSQKQNSTLENEDNGAQHPKSSSSKSLNLNFADPQNVGVNTIPAKLDQNDIVGLENVPIRSYGFWDGNRIQTGYTTLADSAILLAKYPAAFGYSPSSSEQEVKPLHSVEKNSENNLNGLPIFSTREVNSSNGMAEHRMRRNQEDIRLQPFTVNVNGFNGFDALSNVSNVQQQAKGAPGISVVGRGGILVGSCTGVSDPVAALKMHYAKAEQYNGQAASISREESWRSKGDIGR